MSPPTQPLYVVADRTRLTQALSNLLSNAAKYTPPGGQVWLSAREEADSVVFSVKDSGVGIPADMLDHIFEMFTQVQTSLERSKGGLGIGLTLVRRIVELHNGSVGGGSQRKDPTCWQRILPAPAQAHSERVFRSPGRHMVSPGLRAPPCVWWSGRRQP